MSNRTKIKAPPVSRAILAGTIEEYHERFVVPHVRRLDRLFAALTMAWIVLAAGVVYLLVGG